jgi:hypothetical protein
MRIRRAKTLLQQNRTAGPLQARWTTPSPEANTFSGRKISLTNGGISPIPEGRISVSVVAVIT